MILLDTDVMVDILRGHELAKVWLQSVDEIGMPGLVAMELIPRMPECENNERWRKSYQNINFTGPALKTAIERSKLSRHII
jgi:predicted nucleic acid-binding protein